MGQEPASRGLESAPGSETVKGPPGKEKQSDGKSDPELLHASSFLSRTRCRVASTLVRVAAPCAVASTRFIRVRHVMLARTVPQRIRALASVARDADLVTAAAGRCRRAPWSPVLVTDALRIVCEQRDLGDAADGLLRSASPPRRSKRVRGQPASSRRTRRNPATRAPGRTRRTQIAAADARSDAQVVRTRSVPSAATVSGAGSPPVSGARAGGESDVGSIPEMGDGAAADSARSVVSAADATGA